MEVETDFLSLKDPLDCSAEPDFQNHEENLPRWFAPVEIKIASNVISEEFSSEPKIKIGASLRVRKPRKISLTDIGDDSEFEWKTKLRKRRRTKKGITKTRIERGSLKKTVSDEENLMPEVVVEEKLAKTKVKRDKYLKKYRLMKEKRSYVCDVCKKTFITASHLKEHLSHCQCFPCEECGKVFNNLKSLQKHLTAGHLNDPQLQSDEKEAKGKKEAVSNCLKSNLASEKNEVSKTYYAQLKSLRKYQCEICQKTFITNGHLNTHMYCHSGKKWKCDGCNKNFSCERSLTRHKDTFPGEHWFPCQLCEMTFFRVSNIVKHMEIKHPESPIDPKHILQLNLSLASNVKSENKKNGEDLFSCSKCLKSFYSIESLRIHKEAMHLNSNPEDEKVEGNDEITQNCNIPNYKCNVCLKEFVSLEGFEYHKNNQHVLKEVKKKKRKKAGFSEEMGEEKGAEESSATNFVCKICSESFSVKSALQVHLKTHNVTKNVEVKSGSHQCCICPRSFASSDGLKYHLATHTGERRYSCGQCGKKFIKKTHLSEHIATHSEVKYFKCYRCPRTFSTHSAYRKHIKHFPGPHSFPCTKCGKLFTKESMIEKHVCVDLVKVTIAPDVKALLSENINSTEKNSCSVEKFGIEESVIPEPVVPTNHESEAERVCLQPDNSGGDSDMKIDNGSHSCYKCFKVFPSLDLLQTHQLEHIGKQNYQCRFCPESFKRADAFSVHIRTHLGSTPYMCLKCNRKFISPLTLSMHAKNYPGDHSFTCPKCERWFPSEKRLEKHECILQNSEAFTCACGSLFKKWSELQQHAGLKPYKCCSCDLKYSTLVALVRHIKKHTGVKPFSCEVCGKCFRAKNNYLHHKNIHKDVKEIQCEHCDFKSKSQKRMDFHLFKKHDIRSNTSSTLCPVCGIIFPYMTQMKKHMEVEHGDECPDEGKSQKMALCTLCGKLLNNEYTLSNHMKKVHDPNGQKMEREFKCEICCEKFKSSKQLQRHSEVHEEPGLRTCEVCAEEFYFSKDLRIHMKKHDTKKPYSCLKCGKAFKVAVSLKYHSSICGNPCPRGLGSKRKKKENFSNENPFYGHIEPLELNRPSYFIHYAR